ncbi:hypothetical protein [Flavobacterium ajazii]|uniref:hypothetical protein n=1 Tax=Flavobacterium ajazii TaxID=2692318 RepID=UPI0013D38F5A|nr:hypothetical protein [Flavobacterium ajazii]
MENFKKLKDRELLELILINQVSIMQTASKMKEVIHSLNSQMYSGAHNDKIRIYDELMSHADGFKIEFENYLSNEE